MTTKNLDVVLAKEVQTIEKNLTGFKIETVNDMKEATEILSNLNKHLDAITEEKEKVTKPLNAALKAERARWSPIEDKLEAAIKLIRMGMSAFQTAELKRQRAEEDKIAARVKEGKGNLSAETAVKKIDAIEKAPEQHSTEAGLVKFRTDKVLKITDETKIPRKYLVVNEKLLLADLKAGNKIAGAEIEEIQTPINFR